MSPRDILLAGVICVSACGGQPPSYPDLVASRLRSELPGASVAVQGDTLAVRLGARETRIDVAEIQRLCNRGPRDCEYALGEAVQRARGEAR